MTPRREALRTASGDQYAIVQALVYVGDQLANLAAAAAEPKPDRTVVTPPYYEAIPAPRLEDDPSDPPYVPGRLIR